MPVNWEEVRAQFPALSRWTYLNTATFGQMPECARAAVTRHFEHRNELACFDFLDWFNDADRLRGRLAEFVGGEADDIAFIPNAANALSLLLEGLEWEPGDRIVTLRNEFPNNIYHPALLRKTGVELVESRWEGFYDAICARTRLVVLSTVNYMTGFRPPLEEIAGFLRPKGVMLYLDGTQSVGALQFDAKRISPDMLAVHAYKWLLSPNGAGFMYVHPRLREKLEPTTIGWRSHSDWRSVDNLHHGAPEFKRSAEKYEGGMLPFALLYAMEAVVEWMLQLGPEIIEQRVMELAAYARRSLSAIGATFPYEDHPALHSPILAARFEGVDASRLALVLKERRVLVSARHGNLRVSAHLYNNEADIDTLSTELRRLL